MKRVLITGGAGFIGYHLANRLLNLDYQIDLVDNFARGVKDSSLTNLSKNNVNLFDIDLLNKNDLQKFEKDYDLIFHLAAIIGVQFVLKSPYDVLAKNVRLLENIIDFGREQKALKRLVFISTSEVYAGTLQYYSMKIPTPEDTPLTITGLSENRTSYMLSKIYGEALSLHSGLPTTIVRPHNFYGPRMGLSHVIPELFKKAYFANDGTLDVFSPDHKRTFCYIDDAVEMMIILAESKQSLGQAFNIGNESPEITIKELAEKIIKITRKNLTIIPKSTTAGSPSRRCPDMFHTISITEYSPKIDLLTGLKRTFDWYKANVFDSNGLSAV